MTIHRPKVLCVLVLILTVQLIFPLVVNAQQQAGQAIPETRNPQDGPIQPFQQRGGLQEPVPRDVLNQERRIILPAGEPAQPTQPAENDTGDTPLAFIAIFGLLGLGLLGLWLSSGKKPRETKTVEIVSTEKPEKRKSKKKPRSKRRNR